MKISVIGLGYVGAVSVACLAKDGHSVIGVDPVQTKVDMIAAGRSPIVEKDVDDLLCDGARNGLISATTCTRSAIASTDVSLVCVGTPSQSNGNLDLQYVRAACE